MRKAWKVNAFIGAYRIVDKSNPEEAVIARDPDLKITAIQAPLTSFPVKPADGIGIEVDKNFIARHPVIEMPGYV